MWPAIIGAIIGLAGTAYSTSKQADANKKLQDDADNAAQKAAEDEQKLLAQNAKENEDNKATVLFGTQDDEAPGTYDDFFAAATPNQITNSKNTGLSIV